MTEIVSPQSVALVEALAGLDSDNLSLLRDMMALAGALGPERSGSFLRECQTALDSEGASPTALVSPVIERWACEVAS